MENKNTDIGIMLGNNVKKYRKLCNLSQEEFAERSGLTARFISQVETGKAFPSKNNIELFAEIFDIPAFLLFCPDKLSEQDIRFRDLIHSMIKEELERTSKRIGLKLMNL